MNWQTTNNYQLQLTQEFFDKCPKAVFAALAVSYALRVTNEDFSKVQDELLNEWQCLHSAGIVPQKPIKQK